MATPDLWSPASPTPVWPLPARSLTPLDARPVAQRPEPPLDVRALPARPQASPGETECSSAEVSVVAAAPTPPSSLGLGSSAAPSSPTALREVERALQAQRQVLEAMIAEDTTAQGYLARLANPPVTPGHALERTEARGRSSAEAAVTAADSSAQGTHTHQASLLHRPCNVSVASLLTPSMAPAPVVDPRTATPPPRAIGAPPVPTIWTTPQHESPACPSATEPRLQGGAGPLAAWANQTPRQPRPCEQVEILAAAPPTPASLFPITGPEPRWEPPASLFYFCHLSEARLPASSNAPASAPSFAMAGLPCAFEPPPSTVQEALSSAQAQTAELRERRAELSRLLQGQEEAAAARRQRNEAEATRLERRASDLASELEAARQAEHSLRRELGRALRARTGGASSLPLGGACGSATGRAPHVSQSEPGCPRSPRPMRRHPHELHVLARA